MSTDTPSPAPLPPASKAPPPASSKAPLSAASKAPLSATSRTTLRRHKERGRTSRGDLYAVLDAGLICHLGVVINGSPRVLPTTYARSGDTLYLHGSSANAGFMAADGTEVCVTVTHLDGLVLARSVFSHSVNYRSAIVIGTATLLRSDDERMAALRAIVEHLVPGQWAAARQPTAKEMAATAVLTLPLAEASVKVREGGPADDTDDMALDVWAGVLPAAVTFGPPEPDPALRSDITASLAHQPFPGHPVRGAGDERKPAGMISGPADTAQIRA